MSTSVVEDKDLMFSIIVRNADKPITEIMSAVYEAIFSDDGEEESGETVSRSRKSTDSDRDLFISYSSKDYETAAKVREILEDRGIACWMAPASIPGGADYL